MTSSQMAQSKKKKTRKEKKDGKYGRFAVNLQKQLCLLPIFLKQESTAFKERIINFIVLVHIVFKEGEQVLTVLHKLQYILFFNFKI